MESVVQLVTVSLVFLIVLALSYFTTRWIGNYQKGRFSGKNIELMEALRLNQSQYIQIVRTGERYIILGVSKDNITLLGELGKDEYVPGDTDADFNKLSSPDSFKKILETAKEKLLHK